MIPKVERKHRPLVAITVDFWLVLSIQYFFVNKLATGVLRSNPTLGEQNFCPLLMNFLTFEQFYIILQYFHILKFQIFFYITYIFLWSPTVTVKGFKFVKWTVQSLNLRNMVLLNGAFQKFKNPLGLASTSLRSELTKPQWIFGFLKSPI